MHVEGSRHARLRSSAPLRQILIIGGTSDLSRRHLLPALTRLLANGELPEGFSVTVTGLESMPAEACRALVARELEMHAAHLPVDARQSLAEQVSYLAADVRDAEALRALTPAEPLLVYVATPPALVPAALRAVERAGIHRSARLVLDKPFGLDLASARALNAQVLGLVQESNVFRVDHFLYHHTVQELARWRAQSDPFSLVDLLPVSEAEIVWDETRAAQTSSDAYVGVVRDMIQSHLLQLVAVITMDPPESMTHTHLTGSRLAALRRISTAADSVTQSATPTFATLALRSQMPRWERVRFSLRAAKGADTSRRHIELRFAHGPAQTSPGFVRLEVLAGKLTVGVVGGEVPVEFAFSEETESASTRLLRAALVGDDTFTLDAEEPQEAWRIVEPVLDAWESTAAGRRDA